MSQLFFDAVNFGGGIIVGGVAGALADNLVGLTSLYGFYGAWSPAMSAVIQAAVGSVAIVPLGWAAEFLTGFPAAVVMMAAFTAMPNYRAALKSIVLGVAGPINSRVDSL